MILQISWPICRYALRAVTDHKRGRYYSTAAGHKDSDGHPISAIHFVFAELLKSLRADQARDVQNKL